MYVYMYVCMYVCMCVHNGFTIEIDRFTHNVHTSLSRAAHDAITTEVRVKDLEDRRQTPE